MFSYLQDKSFLYFFTVEGVDIRLMKYNLLTNIFTEMYVLDETEGILLSVSFFHRSSYETLVRAENDASGDELP